VLCAAVGVFVPEAFRLFEPGFLAAEFLTRPKTAKWTVFVLVNVGLWWAAYAALLSFLKWVRSPIEPGEPNSVDDERGGSDAGPPSAPSLK
jgi:hypothetical protein